MNTTTNRAADNIRILAASMVEKAKSGHPGGAMGGADYINVLYSEFLNFDPDDGEWVNRDRFFLDPGHMSPMLYATLSLIGKYSMEDLKNFRQWGSITPGHPEVDVKRGVENTSGPLGQGHAMAVGAAIAERFLVARFGEWMAHKTYAFISDGGIQEEISQGAGRIAGTLGLANLIMFYDSNNIQLSTKVDEVTHEDTAKKYEAWGWQVITIDGNDAAEQPVVRHQKNALGSYDIHAKNVKEEGLDALLRQIEIVRHEDGALAVTDLTTRDSHRTERLDDGLHVLDRGILREAQRLDQRPLYHGVHGAFEYLCDLAGILRAATTVRRHALREVHFQ